MSADGAVAADTQPTVDPQHPWLGLASFTEESRGYFHGREDEVGELSRRVQRKLLTILFGQSGLGKTSILRAGIVPRLRPEGYCPVYVRIDYSPEAPSPTEQIKQAIFRATESMGAWTQAGAAVAGESLWEFLHHRDDILKDGSGKTVIPLLIFDQFEEIFTLAQADDRGRKRAAQFIEDLGDLVENRPPQAVEARLESDDTVTERFDFGRADYRILIALREDYLAHLEGVKGVMPSITQNRMRLARMNGQQALAAVTKPGGKLVSQEVAESIVRFIAGGSELPNAEVEPSLLSLICRELNNTRIAQGRAEISADLLAGSHDTILAEFYERTLADQPEAVRKVIEDQLLTESGYRESLAEERLLKAFAAAGAAPDALATLVNRRLLRIEERLDVRRVELTHDVLCGVVKASRGLRLEREAKEEAEKQLAAQKAREEATRKALVRARRIAAGCAVLALGAIVSALFGYMNMNRAREAEAQAQQTRELAEGARAEAEKLVVFLLEDFQLELEPIGRLDVVANLARRALDYYAGLPEALRTPTTRRNRALAEVRYALSLRNLGRLEEGTKAAASAVATLEELRKGGDTSEATTIGLAMGHSANARILSQQVRIPESRKVGARAFAVIEPLATAPGASLVARRAFAEMAVAYGFLQMRDQDFEEAIKTFEKSRAAARSIDGLQLSDLSSAALFVEATAWEMDALMPLGRMDEARKIGEEARPIANGILEKQPGHMLALRARGLLLSNFGDLMADQLRWKSALPFYAAAAADYKSFLKVDPGNTISWNNLGANLNAMGLYAEGSGQPREGLKQLRRASQSGRQGTMTAARAQGLIFPAWHMARIELELGNREGSDAAMAEVTRLIGIAVRDLPPAVVGRVIRETWPIGFEAERQAIRGDFAGARDKVATVLARIEPLKPESDGQKRFVANSLAGAYHLAAVANYAMKDYVQAETAARRAVENKRKAPPQNRVQELVESEMHMMHAQALARLGRLADARVALEPATAFYRQLPGDVSEAEWARERHARLRLAEALAYPDRARTKLAEAAALIDGLSPDLRRYASMVRLRNEIALEQAARR